MKFLVQFVQSNETFRLPELQSLADMHGLKLTVLSDYTEESPFLWVDLPSEEAVLTIMQRAVSIRAVYDIWADDTTLEGIFTQLDALSPERFGDCIKAGTTFKLNYGTFGKKVSNRRRELLFKGLDHIPLESDVDLKNPKHILCYVEDYGCDTQKTPDLPYHVYMGRQVAAGDARRLIHDYKLTERNFIGTTSMDPELSLLCANMAWARPSSLVYDPFAGTGSIIISCAHFGAHTIGSDIDPRVIRGREHNNILGSFRQYGFEHRLVDLCVLDFAHMPIRPIEWFDAIVCDPPYGIREDARMIGVRKPSKIGQIPKDMRGSHIPQTVRYSLAEVLNDVLEFGAKYLRMNGRLVYWMPVCKLDYKDEMLPEHPSLTLVSNCENPMAGRWSRRLVTMTKTAPYQ
eukprot:Ihof_evm3s323 gene=Ihof_evmTU3s323